MKYKTSYFYIIILSFIFSLVVVTSCRADYSIDNNGGIKKNPYGKCNVPSSYEGASYYDCYLPYAKTVKDIGGYCTSGLTDAQNGHHHDPMPQTRRSVRVGDFVNYQSDYSSLASCAGDYYPAGSSYATNYESDTGSALYVAKKGYKCYAFAIQEFFYNKSGSYYGFSVANRGQLVDVVLTDGTVIHFVVGDANGSNDTNGWGGATFSSNDRQVTKLNYGQYKSMFSSIAGNCIELWGHKGCNNSFTKKYKLDVNPDDGKPAEVHIAFYRMYNKKLSDEPKRAKGVGDGPAYRLDGVKIDSSVDGDGGDPNSSDETEVSITTTSPIPDEWDLHGMPDKAQIKDEQQPVDLPQGIGDTSYDVKMQEVKENMGAAKQNRVSYIVRVLVVSLGLLILVYMALLIGCWIMDKANNIFDFSFVTIITFGIIKPTEAEAREGGVLGAKRLIIICIFCLIVAFLLITGGIYDIGQFLLNKISAIV